MEARGFRDSYKQIQKTGAVLLGVSPDKPSAQRKFADKEALPFTLLADADKKVAIAFGVLQEKNMYGKKVMGMNRIMLIIGNDDKMLPFGDSRRATERQLTRWKFHPVLCREAAAWAWDRHRQALAALEQADPPDDAA